MINKSDLNEVEYYNTVIINNVQYQQFLVVRCSEDGATISGSKMF